MSKKRFPEFDSADNLVDLEKYRDPLPGYPGTSGFASNARTGHKRYGSCYERHPTLELGGGKFIGGSCLSPVTHDADIYIGFDRGMHVLDIPPWKREVTQYLYAIQDMGKPADSKSFIKLIDWSIEKLAAGKTIHAGCIGGHGRTGTYLAALVGALGIDKDAITWARANYCKKAVESGTQVDFLVKHFGVKSVAGAKEGVHRSLGNWDSGGKSHGSGKASGQKHDYPIKASGGWKPKTNTAFADAKKVFNPVKSSTCVFGTLF